MQIVIITTLNTLSSDFAYSVIGIPGVGGKEIYKGDVDTDGRQSVAHTVKLTNDPTRLCYVMK